VRGDFLTGGRRQLTHQRAGQVLRVGALVRADGFVVRIELVAQIGGSELGSVRDEFAPRGGEEESDSRPGRMDTTLGEA